MTRNLDAHQVLFVVVLSTKFSPSVREDGRKGTHERAPFPLSTSEFGAYQGRQFSLRLSTTTTKFLPCINHSRSVPSADTPGP